ncbi:AraC family transcriptional regulator [Catenovulum sediminis]|uniref:AraC family transcriptional regulator n=1 Tax=Catenovulum sediminis TaxID=1740262 RepID=A0ABV1RCU2_9ALTE
MIKPEKFETGSGGFVWQNISSDSIFSDLRMHLYYAYYMQTDSSWAGSQFVNHYNRIYYVESGEAELYFNKQSIKMRPGHLYLIPPYTLNSHTCSGKLNFYWAHFHALVSGDLDLFSLFAEPKEIKANDPAAVQSQFDNLVESVARHPDKPSEIFNRNSLLNQLLLPFINDMGERLSQADYVGYTQFLPVLQHIQNNLASSLKVGELAELANMSLEHFSRRFKYEFNISPKRYILQKRMGLAKQLLLLSGLSISQIAISCGFPDVYHFSKTFSHEMGRSPKSYRLNYKK